MPRKQVFQHRKDKKRQKRLVKLAAKPTTVTPERQSTPLTLERQSTPLTLERQSTPLTLERQSTPLTPEQQSTPLTPEQQSTLPPDFASVPVPNGWIYQSSNNKHVYSKLCQVSGSSAIPSVVSHSLNVFEDCTWSLYVYTNRVEVENCVALSRFPSHLCPDMLRNLVNTVDKLPVCAGHPDTHFVEMLQGKKGVILASNGQTVAYLDHSRVELNGTSYFQTVRSSQCQLIGNVAKCDPCKKYRTNLRAIHNRWHKRQISSTSAHTNERYLNTPEKTAKLSKLRNKVRAAKQEVKKLREKIKEMTDKNGITVDENLHTDLISAMKNNQASVNSVYSEGSFARLFWEEQLKAASVTDSKQMRWHPVMVKWCLNLMLMSGSCYRAMRRSGFLKLPSDRTLRDYTNYFENKPGFQEEVDQQLAQEVASLKLPESRTFVGIILDEMKIKEGLVYNKCTGKIIGFTQLGNINDDLLTMEQKGEHPDVAKYVLALLVRGTMFNLEFPYAHFGTRGITADLLFPIVDEALYRLWVNGLKVISITADGASPNRKLFKLLNSSTDKSTPYKTNNPYSPDGKRSLFFFVDPPHLIKTVRNCWSHSGSSGTRHMQVNGQYIEWKQLWNVYHKVSRMSVSSHGISLLPKLKLEHLKLSSFSRMRVDLAAQVLSETVSNAFAYFNDPTTRETQRFVSYFDGVFDCLNVRSLCEWERKRKPNLKPYRSKEDKRLDWLESDFLKYLHDWEEYAMSQDGVGPQERNKMMLSRETLEGLRITVNSFVEMTRYLLSSQESTNIYFLSERISQDPIEKYFGKQRARGGRNENPNLQQCLHNAAALRVQKSLALEPVRGNCRRKRLSYSDPAKIDNTPLPKRKRK